jgi:large conductance mechanosensitive channel
MKLIKEFQEYAVKGKMMDKAIGIIIGASFNKEIDILYKKVMLPPLSLLSGSIILQDKRLVLRDAILGSDDSVIQKEVAIGYGALLEAFLDFLIVGFTIFIVVKVMNRLKKKAQDIKDTTVTTPKDIELLSQLTSLMKEQNKLLKEKIV